MNFRSVKTKIAVLSGICLLLSAASVVGVGLYYAKDNASYVQSSVTELLDKKTKEYMQNMASTQAGHIRSEFDVALQTARTMADNFGVLPGHAPLVSSLRMGVLKVHDNGELAESYFVTGGFAEVSAERCIVVAEEAQPVSDIKRAEVEALLGRLGTALSASTDQIETSRLNQEIEVAKAKLALAA